MIAGLLLAAGAARRFGNDKLLHPLPNGLPMAVQSARALNSVLPGATAVVRPSSPLRARLGREGLRVVECHDAAFGMGHSLACAVAASADADGWVIALADMPFVRPGTIARVAAALAQGASIAAPAFAGRRGHPVGFSRQMREGLLALTGDAGAHRLLAEHAVTLLPADDPGVLIDIDRPEQLTRTL